MTQGKSTEFLQKYSKIRSANLCRTLLGLKEYVRERVATSGSRKYSNVKDTPKKSSNRRTSALARKATTLLRKDSMQSLSGASKGGAYPPIAEEEVVEIDSEPFLEMVTYTEKLFTVEQGLLRSIIPESSRRNIYDSIIQASLVVIEQDGKKFVSFAKQCVAKRDHPSVISIFPAIKHLKLSLPSYHEVLKNTSENNRVRIPGLIAELDATGSKVLEDFTDSVKSDPEKESNMSKDGTVHELTSNAMLFLQQLTKNLDVAGGMLASQQHHGAGAVGNKSEQCLSQYTGHVLGALKLNLENKSRVYMDPSLAAIFLLNNYNYILSALNREGLLDLVQLTTPETGSIYKMVIAEQKKKYLRSWDKFVGYLSDDNKQGLSLHVQPGMRLKDKEKQIVKEKFKSFNNDLDDIIKLHGTWAVPDVEIRTEIRKSLRDKIIPMYTAFRDKYRMVQFTKNIEKYLKHSPETVAESIDKLFN